MVSVFAISFAQEFVFAAALFLWVPFFLVMLLMVGLSFNKLLPAPAANHKVSVLTFFKITAAFLLMVACYFALGQGLLLYQTVAYDTQGQPVLTQFTNADQLFWAVKLGLGTWVMASSLMMAMGVMHLEKISEFFKPWVMRHKGYALFIDYTMAFAFSVLLLLFISIAVFELSRVVVASFGFERPIYPEMTAIILAMTLFPGYFLLHFKKRSQALVQKSASIGRMLLVQSALLIILLFAGQAVIVLAPQEMVSSLMKPIMNVVFIQNYAQTWLLITLAAAIISAPLLARFLARHLMGLRVWQAFLMLMAMPACLGIFLIQHLGLQWIPSAYFTFIGVENVVYRIGATQIILISSALLLLLCFAGSKSLQMAWVDIMPVHMGQRLRRLRTLVAKEVALFVFFIVMYIFFANYSYYFFSSIFLILVTLGLLWVSLYSFYNLTNKR